MSAPTRLEHPNREKASSRVVKWTVVLLLSISSLLLAVMSYRGWDLMQQSRTVNLVFIALNVVFLIQVARWRRGVLPMAAAIAAFIGIFSGASIGSWYDRNANGYAEAALSADLGLLATVILSVQVVVIGVAVVAFSQAWQVESEVHIAGSPSPEPAGAVV